VTGPDTILELFEWLGLLLPGALAILFERPGSGGAASHDDAP
jgi:hypothetical protein